MKVAIIGGGAAGFFAAIQVKENYPNAQVVIFEKSSKVLSKVKVSGGGRCNVTNGCTHTKELLQGYPRGNKVLKQGFRQFNNQDTRQWFQQRGVKLKTEKDGRVFPVTNKSQTIIDCFFREVQKHRIDIQLQKTSTDSCIYCPNDFHFHFCDGKQSQNIQHSSQ